MEKRVVYFNPNNDKHRQQFEFLSKFNKDDKNELMHYALDYIGRKVGWVVPPGGLYGLVELIGKVDSETVQQSIASAPVVQAASESIQGKDPEDDEQGYNSEAAAVFKKAMESFYDQ